MLFPTVPDVVPHSVLTSVHTNLGRLAQGFLVKGAWLHRGEALSRTWSGASELALSQWVKREVPVRGRRWVAAGMTVILLLPKGGIGKV